MVLEENIIPVTRKGNLQWPSGSKNSQKNFTREAGVHALIRRWNIAIERNGDYVEK